MSKLYNTLEKIRTGEQGGFPQQKPSAVKGIGLIADKSRRRQLFLFGASVVLVLALAVFFAGTRHKGTNHPPVTAPVASVSAVATPNVTAGAPERVAVEQPAETVPPVSLIPSPTGTGNDLYNQLNDTGIALIQGNQHWRGIYYLEQARKQQPERPEALINMAAALAELGLQAPAKRLFSEAHALAPNHPLLRKNLELLVDADFFDRQWLSALTAGQAQTGHTAQPR